MKRRWVVRYGPEFAESKNACRGRVTPSRLRLHLDAVELNLERDPFEYSEQFGDSNVVVETKDYFGDGFVLTAYVRLCEDFVAEIMWIDMRALPVVADEDDD